MTRAAFERSSLKRSRSIPRRFATRDAEHRASSSRTSRRRELLEEMEIEPPDTLLGLYQGTPLTERAWALRQRAARPHHLFQRPIEEDCEDEDEVVRRDRRDADPRDRPLLRAERRRDRGDRGALLARRDARADEDDGSSASTPSRGAQAVRPALPRAGLGRQARRRARRRGPTTRSSRSARAAAR